MTTDEDLDAKHVKMSARIFNSAKRMEKLVSDLLDLTRTRLGSEIPLVRHSVDLALVCTQAVEEIRAFFPDRTVDFRQDGDLKGEWDGDRLAQVMSNLLGNAVQHGSASKPIEVTARPHGEGVIIRVHNFGPVIKADQIPKIFDPLVRYGNSNSPPTNLGLGLFIVKAVVEAHGGSIDVKSSEREGTLFTVKLPLRATQLPT